MSTAKSISLPVVLLVMLVLAVLGLIGWSNWRSAAAAADYSAHAALTKEICDQLAVTPPGQYPASLSKLRLTFPDGGDPSLLDRFEYHSTGATCTLRTKLVWGSSGRDAQVIVCSYPQTAAE